MDAILLFHIFQISHEYSVEYLRKKAMKSVNIARLEITPNNRNFGSGLSNARWKVRFRWMISIHCDEIEICSKYFSF